MNRIKLNVRTGAFCYLNVREHEIYVNILCFNLFDVAVWNNSRTSKSVGVVTGDVIPPLKYELHNHLVRALCCILLGMNLRLVKKAIIKNWKGAMSACLSASRKVICNAEGVNIPAETGETFNC